MECYRYRDKIKGKTPNKLYIPNEGVLEYNIDTKRDSSFIIGPTAIKIAKEVLEGAFTNLFTSPKKTDLPEDKIIDLIGNAKKLDKADKNLQETASSLIDLI